MSKHDYEAIEAAQRDRMNRTAMAHWGPHVKVRSDGDVYTVGHRFTGGNQFVGRIDVGHGGCSATDITGLTASYITPHNSQFARRLSSAVELPSGTFRTDVHRGWVGQGNVKLLPLVTEPPKGQPHIVTYNSIPVKRRLSCMPVVLAGLLILGLTIAYLILSGLGYL